MEDSKKYLFRVISDIHLETLNIIPNDIFVEKEPKKIEKILILAGDIGDPFTKIYKQFLIESKKRYEKVIVIPGNHEYYNDNVKVKSTKKDTLINQDSISTKSNIISEPRKKMYSINEVNSEIEKICQEHGCIFLNRTEYILDNKIRIAGAVLWGKVEEENYTIINENKPNIFKYIYNNDTSMDVKMFNNLNKLDKEFIKNLFLNKGNIDEELPLIIVTHYAPSCEMIPEKYKTIIPKEIVCSDMENYFKAPLILWIYGHIHDSKTVMINNIEFTNNSYTTIKENNYRKDYIFIL